MPVEEATRNSPLRMTTPKKLSDVHLNTRMNISEEDVRRIIGEMDNSSRWLSPLRDISNPYIGDAPVDYVPTPEEVAMLEIRGDRYDTSPYTPDEPVIGISTKYYMQQINKLASYIRSRKQ